MELTVVKVVAAIVLFILTILFGFSPYFYLQVSAVSGLSQERATSTIASLNCFSGGVFFGTLMMHIWTQGAEDFHSYSAKVGLDSEYPIFNIFLAAGFFLAAFVELIAKIWLVRPHGNSSETMGSESGSEKTSSERAESSNKKSYKTAETSTIKCDNRGDSRVIEDCKNETESIPLNTKQCTTNDANTESLTSCKKDSEDQEGRTNVPICGVRVFLLLLALSCHTIFDGLTVGLKCRVAEVWSVFAAVATHKSITSFCLGVEMFQNNMHSPLKAALWLGIFAVMCPLGIAAGVGLTPEGVNETAKLLTSSLLQGLAGGIFMYATLLQILAAHIGRAGTDDNCWHLPLVLAGFCVTAVSKTFGYL